MRGGVKYDPVKGKADFIELGGLDEPALLSLASQPNDRERRLALSRWFGHHGALFAWEQYRNSYV